MHSLSRGISSTAELHNFHYFHLPYQLAPSHHVRREELNFEHLWVGSPVTLLSSSSDLPKVLTVFRFPPSVNPKAGLRW